MTAGWCTRTLRAAMFAAVCVLLAALGHVLMSGDHVPAWALAAGAAATGAVGWCLAGRERGPVSVVAVVVAAQTLLHWAFEYAQTVGAHAAVKGMGSMSVDAMDAMDAMDATTDAAGGMAGMGGMDMVHMAGMGHMGHMGHTGSGGRGVLESVAGLSSSGMFAAHLLAALLCGLWLAHGERAAFRVLRALAGRLAAPLRLLLALPLAPERPRIRPRRRRSQRAPRLLLVHAITSRGPPLGAAAV
ncbi:hypothetical protein [Streptomyces griseoruber]|uniref:PE-PGRS family protein n=1 Tax=Streptomyces griseoruber TaxID=1943 RepID=A0A101SKX2_9ACTN|nr:hypothetical protein [Streptomyces griseoruber]KUN75771.1 hypothetical protein AQJ64_40835 [Streptomyces griseoruber]